MKVKKLNLKKEIIANLSNTESNLIKGGSNTSNVACTIGTDCWVSGCVAGCLSAFQNCWNTTICETIDPDTQTCDVQTGCCGISYNIECLPR